VASRFNCLESLSPEHPPKVHGVTTHANGENQGRACALACAVAMVFRHYFVPVKDQDGVETKGQRGGAQQINTLVDLAAALALQSRLFWEVRNGFLCPSSLQSHIEDLDPMPEENWEELKGLVRIGLMRDAQVIFATGKEPRSGAEPLSRPTTARQVSQAFCGVGVEDLQGKVPAEEWEPLAKLTLEAAYEATLWAAVIDQVKKSCGCVWLTLLGSHSPCPSYRAEWDVDALGRTCDFNADLRAPMGA